MPQLSQLQTRRSETSAAASAVWRDGSWSASARFLALLGTSRMPQVEPPRLAEAVEALGRARQLTVSVEPLPDEVWVATLTARTSPEQQSRMLQITSHDLRGPMANIRAYAAFTLEGKTPLEPRLQRSLEVILRNADKVLGLLSDYFDSAQAQLGTLELDLEPQPILPLLEGALAKVRAAAEEKKLSLAFDHAEALPDLPVDASAFDHATVAFLENGIARSHKGAQVRMVARLDAGGLRVEVVDGGAPVADPDGAFDRERRTIAEGKLAVGFRLALARDEIELLDGHVGVEARGERTAFFFTVPVEQATVRP